MVCLAKTMGLAFFLAQDQENRREEMANETNLPVTKAIYWLHTGIGPPGIPGT